MRGLFQEGADVAHQAQAEAEVIVVGDNRRGDYTASRRLTIWRRTTASRT